MIYIMSETRCVFMVNKQYKEVYKIPIEDGIDNFMDTMKVFWNTLENSGWNMREEIKIVKDSECYLEHFKGYTMKPVFIKK